MMKININDWLVVVDINILMTGDKTMHVKQFVCSMVTKYEMYGTIINAKMLVLRKSYTFIYTAIYFRIIKLKLIKMNGSHRTLLRQMSQRMRIFVAHQLADSLITKTLMVICCEIYSISANYSFIITLQTLGALK